MQGARGRRKPKSALDRTATRRVTHLPPQIGVLSAAQARQHCQQRARPKAAAGPEHCSGAHSPCPCAASMAAYGGHGAVEGLQIFVTLRRGRSWPPAACDVRIRYDQTVGDVKDAVAAKMGLPREALQIFWHKRELTTAANARTLLDMSIHTGFALKGYDLTEPPVYFPPVRETDDGLVEEDAP